MRLGFRLYAVVPGIAAAVLLAASPAHADFGLTPGSVSAIAENSDGTIDTQAGSHPYQYTVRFSFNRTEAGKPEGAAPRDIVVDLPPGVIGDPLAVPRCLRSQFEGVVPHCPADTQVGVLHAVIPGEGEATGPVYNLVPPAGVAAQIAFSAAAFNAFENASVLTDEGYGVRIGTYDLPLEIGSITETIWGVPADPGHDSERGLHAVEGEPETSTAPLSSFFTLPTSCAAPLLTTVLADSSLAPGVFVEQSATTDDAAGNPAPLTGCRRVPFVPEVAVTPTSRSADSATGLTFALALPNDGLLSPGAVSESEPRKTVVSLPVGVTVNPSMAVGIDVCTPAQYAAERPDSAPGAGCPEASKIGDVVARSPLVEEPIEGAIYLASPYENPFRTLVAGYLVVRARDRGVIVKQAGKIEFDQTTGQITATFAGLPPLPYSSLVVSFREGTRAPLVNPPVCGSYTTHVSLTPFSVENDSEATTSTSGFTVGSGVGGGPCPAAGVPSFTPGLTAGMINNAAGHYSPLYLRIERKDGEQEITGFSTQLPPGLSGNLSGIPFCGGVEIQHAREQSGAEAENNPACPAGSLIGHVIAEAGVGPVLAQAPGSLYLSGPFEGAPFSVTAVTAAKVGPFDLGTVVLRLPLQIDPNTAQVSIPSGQADQIPHIVKGIVVHLRAIRVYVDRQSFTLNPTSCAVKNITDIVNGAGQNVASPADDTTAANSSRFQAAGCANLAFKPSFNVSTSGKTSKASGASLIVKLAYSTAPQGTQANIRSVKVDLPKQLPSRLTTLQKACTAAQFHTNPAGCPAASVVGHARAITPILPVPLEGPAYFVSNGGEAFPNLIMVLQGYGITIDLTGNTFINKAGVTSSTFPAIPDQPVTSFELVLPEGPNSALAANGNLCTSKLTTPNEFVGQNGATFTQNTKVTVTGCPKTKTLTRAQKLALALKACKKKPKGAKRKACERQARKKYGPLKKAKGAKRK
jgi:hypothetical protein